MPEPGTRPFWRFSMKARRQRFRTLHCCCTCPNWGTAKEPNLLRCRNCGYRNYHCGLCLREGRVLSCPHGRRCPAPLSEPDYPTMGRTPTPVKERRSSLLIGSTHQLTMSTRASSSRPVTMVTSWAAIPDGRPSRYPGSGGRGRARRSDQHSPLLLPAESGADPPGRSPAACRAPG